MCNEVNLVWIFFRFFWDVVEFDCWDGVLNLLLKFFIVGLVVDCVCCWVGWVGWVGVVGVEVCMVLVIDCVCCLFVCCLFVCFFSNFCKLFGLLLLMILLRVGNGFLFGCFGLFCCVLLVCMFSLVVGFLL